MASSHSRPAAAPGAGQGQGHVPIHQRVADLLRHRNERLAKAQLRAVSGMTVSTSCQQRIASADVGVGNSNNTCVYTVHFK